MADHDTSQGLSRRTALKAGAVGGAALWTVPLAQVVGTGVAEATSGGLSMPPGGGGPGDEPGGGSGGDPTSAAFPSNGLILLSRGGEFYAVQVIPNSTGTAATFADAGRGVAVAYLASLGYNDVSFTGFPAGFDGFAATLSSVGGIGSVTVVAIPAGYTVVTTAVKDGGYTFNGTSLTFTKVKGF